MLGEMLRGPRGHTEKGPTMRFTRYVERLDRTQEVLSQGRT
jgi:hypothetical protein